MHAYATEFYKQLVSGINIGQALKEAKPLVEAGFEYVTAFDGHRLFRKRK